MMDGEKLRATSETRQEEGKRYRPYFNESEDENSLQAASSIQQVERRCLHPNVSNSQNESSIVGTSCGLNQKPNRPDWMSGLGSRFLQSKVGEVFWPGTHDSGAYCQDFDYGKVVHHDTLRWVGTHLLNCLGSTVNKVASEWSRTQTMSVKEQLEHGVRYLDLRISRCAQDNCYYIVHSFCGPPLDEVLHHMDDFLRQHEGECLLVEVDPVSKVNHKELHDRFQSILGDLLQKRKNGSPFFSPMSLTLSDLIANGRVVVLYRMANVQENKECLPCFWDSMFICAPFVMSLDPSVKEGHQFEQFLDFIQDYHDNADKKHQNLFHFMYALTPTLSEILGGAVKPIRKQPAREKPGNLQECAQRINPRLVHFLEMIKEHFLSEKCSDMGMIFSVDFIGESELMDHIISLNELRFTT